MTEILITPPRVLRAEARPEPPRMAPNDIPTALLVECSCPDACDRDHDRD